MTNSTNIAGIQWQEISAAKAAALGIDIKLNRTVKIRKEIVISGDEIKFTDLPLGSHIVLSNVNGLYTIFRKFNDHQVEYATGNTLYYYGGNKTPQYWFHFPDYAVNGNGYGNGLILIIKEDLTFIGGNGTLGNPSYPTPAGAISGGGGDSEIDYTDKYQQIINSLIYGAEKQEELNLSISEQTQYLQQQAQSLQEQVRILKIPKIKYFGLSSGATVSTELNVKFDLIVESNGFLDNEIDLFISVDGSNWQSLGKYNGSFNYTFSSYGYKTIKVKVVNPNGDYAIDICKFFIVNG